MPHDDPTNRRPVPQTEPVVLYFVGDLPDDEARRHFVRSLRRELALAEIDGRRDSVEDALDTLCRALRQPPEPRTMLVVRGGDDPRVIAIPDQAARSVARLVVHADPPPWVLRVLDGGPLRWSA